MIAGLALLVLAATAGVHGKGKEHQEEESPVVDVPVLSPAFPALPKKSILAQYSVDSWEQMQANALEAWQNGRTYHGRSWQSAQKEAWFQWALAHAYAGESWEDTKKAADKFWATTADASTEATDTYISFMDEVFAYFVRAKVAAGASFDQLLKYAQLYHRSVATFTKRTVEEIQDTIWGIFVATVAHTQGTITSVNSAIKGAWEKLHKGSREPFSRFRSDTDKVFEEEKTKQAQDGSKPWDVED